MDRVRDQAGGRRKGRERECVCVHVHACACTYVSTCMSKCMAAVGDGARHGTGLPEVSAEDHPNHDHTGAR